MKNFRLLGVFCALIFLFSCKKEEVKNNNDALFITDVLGRKVEVPKKVDKIIGLNAGTLRMLTYIATEKVVGVEFEEKMSGRDAPYIAINSELKEKPSVGPRPGGDAELIIKLAPEVVFGVFYSSEDADTFQEKIGIPVIALTNPEMIEIEEWNKNLKVIGKVLNLEKRADDLIKFVQKNISELKSRTSKLDKAKKVSAYVGGISMRGSHGITSTNAYYSAFQITNTLNVASVLRHDIEKKYKPQQSNVISIDIEQLIKWNPDIIFIDYGGYNIVVKDLEPNSLLRENLSAVKNNNIHLLHPLNFYSTNYEMVIVNSWYIAKVLNPKDFEDVDIQEKIKETLKAFYRKDVSTKMFEKYYKKMNLTEV